MIYLISDLHSGGSTRGLEKYLAESGEGDILVILGDVGLAFERTEDNRRFTEYFLSLEKPIAFIDGNHENHPYLRSFPKDVAYGGPVYRLTSSIVYLQRGNIYEIEGKTFFVMGGCKSSAIWAERGLLYPHEEPYAEEVVLAYKNLNIHNNRVDYVLTHQYKKDTEPKQSPTPLEELTAYIDSNISFTHWYAGHDHTNAKKDDLHTIVYDEPIIIP